MGHRGECWKHPQRLNNQPLKEYTKITAARRPRKLDVAADLLSQRTDLKSPKLS